MTFKGKKCLVNLQATSQPILILTYKGANLTAVIKSIQVYSAMYTDVF